MPLANVDMFERLLTPFGLVRYGVAPDHPRIKSVSSSFDGIAENERFRFFGNVELGRDIQRTDLLEQYDGVVYATGGSKSRTLSIPGAELPNIFGSSTFVGWYNGHPDQSQLSVDLSSQTAVVIGMGNVALDITRMLVLSTEQLEKTDVADEALSVFKQSAVKDIVLIARRGVVCLPHGWRHDREGISLRVAQTNPGVSMNDLTDDQRVDSLSGNAIFNGVPVEISIKDRQSVIIKILGINYQRIYS